MKHKMKLMGAILLVSAIGMAAFADWNVGDGHKMHFPQMPKVDGGWDVQSQYYDVLADDFECSETGYINDIHTWVSFKDDQVFDFNTIHLAIWADDPVGDQGIPGEDPNNTYSKPLGAQALWHNDLSDPTEWTMRPWDVGDQGWYNPMLNEVIPAPEHQQVWQLNFLFDDAEAYWQEQGTIYWLEFGIQSPNELQTTGRLGWKESEDHFNDAAVWRDVASTDWQTLVDPIAGTDMDLAFVITPEPTTVSMVALVSGLAVFIRRRVIG